jgi:hypothetical protein
MLDLIIYKQNAQARKLNPDSNNADKEGYETFIPNFKINVQPITLDFIVTAEGQFGKTYKGFTTQSGLKESMQIVVSGTATVSGIKLKVVGVEEWRGPLGRTFELLLREYQES